MYILVSQQLLSALNSVLLRQSWIHHRGPRRDYNLDQLLFIYEVKSLFEVKFIWKQGTSPEGVSNGKWSWFILEGTPL